MAIVDRLIRAGTALALAVGFIAAGLGVCLMPQTTVILANAASDDRASPFDRSQLVAVAEATRDYAFDSHDLEALYGAIAQVNGEYAQSIMAKGGKPDEDFPQLDLLGEQPDIATYATVFGHASDQYCYSPDAIRHLDDCHGLSRAAAPLLIAIAGLAVAGLIYTGFRGGRKVLGGVLMAAGIGVIALFAALGLWALIDFDGLFSNFHMLFFSQGNWEFPVDSLLICALPTGFWAGMAAVWLVSSLVVAVLSVAFGALLRRPTLKPMKRKR